MDKKRKLTGWIPYLLFLVLIASSFIFTWIRNAKKEDILARSREKNLELEAKISEKRTEILRLNVQRTKRHIKQLCSSVEAFRATRGRLPFERDWPDFLFTIPNELSPMWLSPQSLTNEILWPGRRVVDAWDHPFEYRVLSDEEYEIISYGADGLPGGEGADEDILSKGESLSEGE